MMIMAVATGVGLQDKIRESFWLQRTYYYF